MRCAEVLGAEADEVGAHLCPTQHAFQGIELRCRIDEHRHAVSMRDLDDFLKGYDPASRIQVRREQGPPPCPIRARRQAVRRRRNRRHRPQSASSRRSW